MHKHNSKDLDSTLLTSPINPTSANLINENPHKATPLKKSPWLILSLVFGVFILILIGINIWWINKSNNDEGVVTYIPNLSTTHPNPTTQPSSAPVMSGVQIYSENLDQLNIKALVYEVEGNLYLLEPGSTSPIALTDFPPTKIISDLLFSPDKTKVAFRVLSQEQIDMITNDRSTAYEWGVSANIGILNLPTKEYKEITATAFENLDWVSHSELVYSDPTKIYLVDYRSQTTKVLVDDIGDRDGPRNSTKVIPTPNYLYYSYGIEPYNQGKREIRRINLQDLTETSIISGLNGDDFSPLADDKILVQEIIQHADENSNQSFTTVLSIFDVDSGNKISLTTPQKNSQNSIYYWSDRAVYTIPDSQSFAVKFTDNVTNKVVVYAPDGSIVQEINFDNEANSSQPVQFINDNQFIYLRVIDAQGPYGSGKQRYKTSLLLYDSATKTEVLLLENLESAAVAI